MSTMPMPKIPAQVQIVLDRIKEAGGQACVVGGCVRDMLSGLPPKDYDVATNFPPERVCALFADFTVVETGLKHGTVTVLSDLSAEMPRMPVEVTTFRVDGKYSDNRRPDSVKFTGCLKEDIARRDFTVNAIALDGGGEIIDYYGGVSDLHSGIIRCVGNADERFREDALRILRGLRFACTYGFTIEPDTAAAMRGNRDLIYNLSGERKRAELCKFLMSRNGGAIVALLTEYADVFACIIPEIADAFGFEQHSVYHCHDVFGHIARTVAAAPRDLSLRFAMLLHDLGKPQSYAPVDDVGHFPGHPVRGEEIARRVTAELRFDNKTAREIAVIVCSHDVRMGDTRAQIKRQLNRFGERCYFRVLAAHIADNSAKSALAQNVIPKFIRIRDTARDIILTGECYKISQLAVNGSDILALGINGADVRRYLEALLNAVIQGECANDNVTLVQHAKWLRFNKY